MSYSLAVNSLNLYFYPLAAKERDKANSSKELKDVPAQIRSYEGRIDKIKRDIEYDQQAHRELRQNTDAQNAITVLRGQTVTELENLQESISDHSFAFQKFNLPAPAALPGVGGGDENGDELVEVLDVFATAVRDKYETVQQDLDKARDNQASKQRVVSESQQFSPTTRTSSLAIRTSSTL